MMPRYLAPILLSLVLAGTARAADTPTQFLQTLYGHYGANGLPPDLADVASPELKALIQADRNALDGEADLLDSDPVCACQDADIRQVDIKVTQQGAGKAAATVSFTNIGQATTIRFDLVLVGKAWRVADIHEAGLDSLAAALKREIAAARQ